MTEKDGKQTTITINNKIHCPICGKDKVANSFTKSKLDKYKENGGYIPVCKTCVEKEYEEYYAEWFNVSKDDFSSVCYAIERVCQQYNFYYTKQTVMTAFNAVQENKTKKHIMSVYISFLNLRQHSKKITPDTQPAQKTYFNTRLESREEEQKIIETNDKELDKVSQEDKEFFGDGLPIEDYAFLRREFNDWVSRCECKTKPQEEGFKNLAFIQLRQWKARKNGKDTKDLDKTFQEYLSTLNLQPKQNKDNLLSDTQTFGTMIEKLERTQPVAEPDEKWKDVDNLGLYVDVFFKGHLAKMMGLKNGLSNNYTEYMKQYTVTKPEYGEEEDSEALFDAIFGNQNNGGD